MRICIDFETTSLPSDPNGCGIVQIAAKKFPMDTGHYEFQSLINPELDFWSQRAIDVHKITQEDVKDAPTFFEIFPKFADFVTGCDEWVGYNPEFDVTVLQMALDRYGYWTHFPWPPYRTDVMMLANEYMNMQGKRGAKNPKLTEIYEDLFGKTLDGAHDAMVDVQATIDVLLELEQPYER